MFKLYDKAFKVGFGFSVLVFGILNVISYAVENYKYANNPIKFSPCCHNPSWGFPFHITFYDDLSLNILIIAICGFITGVIFRFTWSKIKPQGLS